MQTPKNYKGEGLVSIPGKGYNRTVKEEMSVIVHCGFRKGRKCVDQVFALKHTSELRLVKGKELFTVYWNLEKTHTY